MSNTWARGGQGWLPSGQTAKAQLGPPCAVTPRGQLEDAAASTLFQAPYNATSGGKIGERV